MQPLVRFALFALAAAVMPAADAATTDSLMTFLQETHAASAQFAQIVVDKNLKEVQRVTGNMKFSRPGKFRWEYDKPYEQVIVGDGKKLWVYDKDLNQVTVRALDQALGSSPAALLAGNNEIQKSYDLTNLGRQEGLDWLEAKPKARDTAFDRIRLGFNKSGLAAMELRDQFGQTTVIRFSSMEHNPDFPSGTFQFTPPKGADVVGE